VFRKFAGWGVSFIVAVMRARKRVSGEGSPRKHDDLVTGPSDLVKAVKELHQRQRAERSEKKRESGGESPGNSIDIIYLP
jgi:hypothetical protein